MPRKNSENKTESQTRMVYGALCIFILIAATIGVAALSNQTGAGAFLTLQFPIYSAKTISTAQAEQDDYHIILEQVTMDNDVNKEIAIDKIASAPEYEKLTLTDAEPTVLIYHTHTTEAYAKTALYNYIETSQWRTDDNTMNIVTVGERLKTLLAEYGIAAIHDTTNHEPPKLATSYSRSVETMEKYKSKYPSLKLFIDVHRDAYGNEEAGLKDVVIINGKEVAKLMFVVGTGEGATGTGFGEKPDFPSNYALAKTLTNELQSFDVDLVRKIRVKTGRYNQHVANHCILVEVGHNANTLDQALNAVEYLAMAIAKTANAPQIETPIDDALAVLRLLP